ncbi:MAG: hypothetical protein V4858_04370 [Pseudomonadota bacterium]
MARIRQIQYLAFSIVISLACWLMASDSSVKSLTSLLFALAPLILLRKGVVQGYRQPIYGKKAIAVAVFTAIFLVFMIVSATTGWTKVSNDWFGNFEYRPVVAAITWVLFVCIGGVAFRSERSLNIAINSDAETSTRTLL